LLLLAAATASQASAAPEMTAATFSQLARARPVSLTGARVVGDVTLGPGAVPHLTCRDCHFDGDLIASGTTFERTLDLSGSDVVGEIDLSSATLGRGMRARATTFNGIVNLRGARVGGDVDMSKASFKAPVLSGMTPGSDVATTTFMGDTDFSLATFSGLVVFERAVFFRNVDFTLATFDTDAVFAGGKSFGQATFARTIFRGPTDFSEFKFFGPATFDGAQFEDRADFSVTGFIRRAVFDRTRFGEGATFLGATFPVEAKPRDSEDSFFGVQADGDLNFAFAGFSRPAGFEYVVVRGTMSFSEATLPRTSALHFSHVSAGSFEMDVESALAAVTHDRATDDRPAVLKLIESSAKGHDDLAVANDAHYARQVLKSEQYQAPVRQLDFVFYRTIAGYFVRPFQPLIALLILASALTLFRLIRAGAGSGKEQGLQPRSRRRSRAIADAAARAGTGIGKAVHALGEFATALLATLTLIAPARKGSEPEREGRQIEIWAYRILFACALIGLANSNPTLREMFDALR
jgi:uncharacterized protein YjbI with pentapeptide repeats